MSQLGPILIVLVGFSCIILALVAFVGIDQSSALAQKAQATQKQAQDLQAKSGGKLAEAQRLLEKTKAEEAAAVSKASESKATASSTNLADLLTSAAASAKTAAASDAPAKGIMVYDDCSGTGKSALLTPGFYRLWRGSSDSQKLDVPFPVKAMKVPTGFVVDLSDSEIEDAGNITIVKETGTTLLCLGSLSYLDNYWIPGILRGLRVRPANTTPSFSIKRRVALYSFLSKWTPLAAKPIRYIDIQVHPNGNPWKGTTAIGVTNNHKIPNTQEVWPSGGDGFIRFIGVPRGLKVQAQRYGCAGNDPGWCGPDSKISQIWGKGEVMDDTKGFEQGLNVGYTSDPYCDGNTLHCTTQTITIMADPPSEPWPGKGSAPI